MSMYHRTATNLLQESPEKIAAWLSEFDAIITDGDATLWKGEVLFTGALEVINIFKSLEKKVYFCTNNASNTKADLVRRVKKFGFDLEESDLITAADATADYLVQHGMIRKVYVIGKVAIGQALDTKQLRHMGIGPAEITRSLNTYYQENFPLNVDEVGAVVVGYDDFFTYAKLLKAVNYLNVPSCMFLATSMEDEFEITWGMVPGAGPLVACVAEGIERTPTVMGKPERNILDRLIRDGLIDPKRTLVIGDSGPMDMLLGYNCGCQTLLVGSGETKWEDVVSWKESTDEELKKMIPDVYLPALGDFLAKLEQAKNFKNPEEEKALFDKQMVKEPDTKESGGETDNEQELIIETKVLAPPYVPNAGAAQGTAEQEVAAGETAATEQNEATNNEQVAQSEEAKQSKEEHASKHT